MAARSRCSSPPLAPSAPPPPPSMASEFPSMSGRLSVGSSISTIGWGLGGFGLTMVVCVPELQQAVVMGMYRLSYQSGIQPRRRVGVAARAGSAT
ncbi:hypothetical protein NDU88_006961 [Pleurodeles waltl]|uniref:Uncharacterized protein n=1 Tax=Pleurodeles waltl TaxID=8319 RepID=A0AAV7QML7_PLEWA|nr:hypothetical protein NDU88_006961 [Pleurodeles waltl]